MSSDIYPLDWYPEHEPIGVDIYGDPIIAFCAEEVRRQDDTPWHVFRMHQAWMYAVDQYEEFGFDRPNKKHILQIGFYIDELNFVGFRTHNIGISAGWGQTKPIGSHYNAIEADIDEWVFKVKFNEFDNPDHAYKAFEDIHPFGDGNGRTGKVLYNWLNGSLHDPVWPHNFWGISNP